MKKSAVLKAKRLELGLSMNRLAKKCGVSHPTLSRIEAGKVETSFETLDRILKALDLSWEEFLTATGHIKRPGKKKGDSVKQTYIEADDERPPFANEDRTKYRR